MIEVHQLTYTYPDGDKPSLREISLSIAKGETIGVMGPNGAGKSTFCQALMGLVPHFYHGTISGDIFIDGVNVPDSNMGEMSCHVGLVFQNPSNQFSGAKLTVEEEIAFGLENLGVDRVTMHERIDWVSELLGISDIRQRNPYQLSGGQMQRVAIASIMALKPKVLVLDEPTSQLDPVGTQDVFAAIDTLREQGLTIVVVEHKSELLVQHCSRLAVLVDATLKAFDIPERIFSHPDIERWGIEVPRYCEVYRLIDRAAQTVPTNLSDTTGRLKAYELLHRRG